MDTIKKLNKKQQEAATYKEGPLLIAAGAGSGKTKTLTSRIMYFLEKGIDPQHILALTFTNKAAQEMKKRVESHNLNTTGLFIGTFHSFGAMILHREARRFNRQSNFTIFDDDNTESLIKKLLKQKNISSDSKTTLLSPGKDTIRPSDVSYRFSTIKNEMVSDDDELAMDLFREYEIALERNNAFDFDDLIQKPVHLFTHHSDALKKYQKKYRAILVDEFQDTNITQYALIKLLAHDHGNISVVGDDAQSIYGWRHADFRNFLHFDKDWPQTKVITLDENYRSSATIIAAASGLISHNTQRTDKHLWTANPSGEDIKVVGARDDTEEADWIVGEIQSLIDIGLSAHDIAVVYRTNAQSRALEQSLIYAHIPYHIYGGIRFYDRKEIKDLMAALRFACNPADEVSLGRLQKTFSKKRCSSLIEQMPQRAREFSITELINFFLHHTDYISYLESHFKNYEERLENIQALISFAHTFSKTTSPSEQKLSQFLEHASLSQSHDEHNGQGGVNLMTIHLSKGLEFDTIFLAGCTDGILPHERSLMNKDRVEEERRLMYVAMTRARKRLFLTFFQTPSRFLSDIPQELLDFQQLDSRLGGSLNDEDYWITY